MLDSRDNSVLKSLKELRKQEEERVNKERAEVEAKAEAARRSKEEAERHAKEGIERAKRDEEERIRRAQEEKESREREERLRLEESDRRARIEAETTLQQERMRLEAQAKTAAQAKGTPVKAIVAVVAVVLVIAGGVIFKIKADHQKQLAEQQAEGDRAMEREKLRSAEQEKRFEQMAASLRKQISEAKSDAERAAFQKQLDDATRARHNATVPSRSTATGKDRDKKDTSGSTPALPAIHGRKQVSDDPLDGLKL
jgi:membrane protein involved in colicin uptake